MLRVYIKNDDPILLVFSDRKGRFFDPNENFVHLVNSVPSSPLRVEGHRHGQTHFERRRFRFFDHEVPRSKMKPTSSTRAKSVECDYELSPDGCYANLR